MSQLQKPGKRVLATTRQLNAAHKAVARNTGDGPSGCPFGHTLGAGVTAVPIK